MKEGTLAFWLSPVLLYRVILSNLLSCTYGQRQSCMVASCIDVHHPIVPSGCFGKKSGCTSMETAMMCGSRSSGPHSADMAIRNEAHQNVT